MKGVKDTLSEPIEKSLLEFASYDSEAAEKTGYSNYSYWGSTFRAFLKNKVAMSLLVVLAVLLVFTIIQPYLPSQFESNLINHPVTGIQMMNVQPGLTNVVETAEEGTTLIVTPWENAEWAAVSNLLLTIPSRKEFTVVQYGADYCQVEYDGHTGYVKNDFTTKLKLPDDFENTPYRAKSNLAVKLFTAPREMTNNKGNELFVKKSSLKMQEDGTAITTEKAELRLLPDTRPFLFGTNNAGQDLWAMVWSGTRTSLTIGVMVAIFQAVIGILIGVLWGYRPREELTMSGARHLVSEPKEIVELASV